MSNVASRSHVSPSLSTRPTSSELERLKGTLQTIQAVLADAESRQIEEKGVQLWLSGVRQVAYDIDNLLEEGFEKDGSSNGDEAGDGYAGNRARTLTAPYTCLVRTFFRYKLAHDVKKIRKRLDQIDKEKTQFNLIRFDGKRRPRPMITSSEKIGKIIMTNGEIIGRDDDSDAVISRLVSGGSSDDDGKQLQVIAIVGIRGMGKTALAEKIYLDDNVRDHFECLYWVGVSDDFDLKRLTKEILVQVEEASTSMSELDSLQNELFEALRGKCFLLVLDNVRKENSEMWKRLLRCLSSGAAGSRILVTTRSESVANTMKAAFIRVLKGLSDDHSWVLFKMKAFGLIMAEEYSHLESVGREIVNKCKGVPLLIIMLGSVMNSESTAEDWPNTLDSKMLSLKEAENYISPDLWQSYCDLPPRLKQCFAFCSIYQKDQVMCKDELVKLWIAQGFVQSAGNREIDDTGAEYFDDLVARSMFQGVSKSDRGNVTFRMHDLLHDLAEFTAKDEIYTFVSSEGGKSEQFPGSNVRHASLSFPDTNDKPKNTPIAFLRARNLQTLLVDGVVDETNRVIVDLLYQARFLRALILSGTKIVQLPKAIWKMKHLRYLSLAHSKIVKLPKAIGKMKQLMYLNLLHSKIMELPESVTHLNNLRTLNVTGCVKLKRLPTGMGQMVSLRHLEIEDTDSLECLPEGLGRIKSLRSFCKFIVGGEGGCQIDELQQLNSLHGSLRIQHLERVSGQEEAEKAELQNKPYLRRLVLSMSESADADSEKMDGVIEGLRPHNNLEELKLFWYTGSNLPRWLELMPRLSKFELCGCPNLKGLLHLLGSAFLRELTIRNCDRIEGISRSCAVFLKKLSVIDSCKFFSSGLPHLPNLKTFEICRFRNETLPDEGWEEWTSLQTLEIWNCSELKSLPDGLMHLKSLQRLKVSSCKKLESLPNGLQHLSLLRRLLINGCPLLPDRCRREGGVDWPKISHVPCIEIDKQMIH